MKKLKFEELWLQSTKEKKAWNSALAADVVTVVADNEFGKSSLVKSLYSTLGVEPHKTPDSWKNAQVLNHFKFSINSISYYILRDGAFYTLFDSERKKLWSLGETRSALAQELLSGRLRLPETIIARHRDKPGQAA